MFKLAATLAFAAALLSGSAIAQPAKPTVILV
ncbi:ABC-type sugar transport system substrate-binding protein, partial [Ensifer sp. 4252]